MDLAHDDFIGLREASERYYVSYGTLVRRVNSSRKFETAQKDAKGEWMVSSHELDGIFNKRPLAEVASAEAVSAELRAEVARLEEALREQEEALRTQQKDSAERLQAARTETAAERARADKANELIERQNSRFDALQDSVRERAAAQREAEQARDRAIALNAKMFDEFPERAQLRRRARPAYEAKLEQLRALRDNTLAIGPGSATDEVGDPS